MWHRNLGKIILALIVCAGALYLIIPVDFMLQEEPRSPTVTPHEDPETAEEVFSSIPSFLFDAAYLDIVLQTNPEGVKAMIRKRPFAQVVQNLNEAINVFTMARVYISNMVMEIDEDLGKLRVLVGQNRFDEATQLAEETYAKLFQADRELEGIEEAAQTTGDRFKVSLAPPESALRRSYDELLQTIDKGREALGLDKDILTNFSKTLAEEAPSLTEITLKIEPAIAFVGDDIYSAGILTSEEGRLAGRKVDILVNGSRYITTRTYSYGYYQDILRVPYRYVPELDLQVLYCPEGEDSELYQFSLSPVIKLKVLFYEAELEVAVEDGAYPGLETVVSGRLDYGHSPPLKERKIEIYFDDVLITEVVAQEAFTQKIRIDPEADVGEHTITVSSAAVGRYSPVVTSVILNVTKVTPILELNTPTVAMIPGSIGLSGKLYSEVGPMDGASIKMRLGKSQVRLVSSEDGTFETEIKTGIGFGLIGWQDLEIESVSREPWQAPLSATSRVFMVNIVSCGILFVMLVFLVIYLPGRLRERLGAYSRRRMRPEEVITRPELAPAYSDSVIIAAQAQEGGQDSGEPRNRIFYWYRLVVRLILGISKAVSKPQQTLREFAGESSRVLGPAARYFIELTKMVERSLYSAYRPTEEDVGKSRKLSHTIEEELKGEGV